MTKGELIKYLNQWPDETEIYLDVDDLDGLTLMSTPTHIQDGDFKALVFYSEEDAKKMVRKWVVSE